MSELNLDFPTLARLFAFEESGHSRDDLFAGYAQPAAQLTVGRELRRLSRCLGCHVRTPLLTSNLHLFAKPGVGRPRQARDRIEQFGADASVLPHAPFDMDVHDASDDEVHPANRHGLVVYALEVGWRLGDTGR